MGPNVYQVILHIVIQLVIRITAFSPRFIAPTKKYDYYYIKSVALSQYALPRKLSSKAAFRTSSMVRWIFGAIKNNIQPKIAERPPITPKYKISRIRSNQTYNLRIDTLSSRVS